jgi:hypothetical protein
MSSARVDTFVDRMHKLAWQEVGKPATHSAFHYWMACQKSPPDQPATLEQIELDLWLTWILPAPLEFYRRRAELAERLERRSVPFKISAGGGGAAISRVTGASGAGPSHPRRWRT